MVRVDLRTVTLTIPPQEVITRDNVPGSGDAVAYFRVVDPHACDHESRPSSARPPRSRRRRCARCSAAPTRPAALRARAAQRGPAEDHRRADRAVGHQGLHRRDQGRRDPRGDAAGDGAPGRGRARAAREDHQRRGRVPGGREARAGRGIIAESPAPPAALPADAARDGRTRTRRSCSRCRSSSSTPSRRWSSGPKLSADSSLTVTVRSTRDAKEIDAAMDLRIRVFCGEQGVSEEEERDELDDEATPDRRPGRLRSDRDLSIALPGGRRLQARADGGRAEGRERGVGGRLLAGAEAAAREHGSAEMLLHAQRRAEPFYASNGYVAEGVRIDGGRDRARADEEGSLGGRREAHPGDPARPAHRPADDPLAGACRPPLRLRGPRAGVRR